MMQNELVWLRERVQVERGEICCGQWEDIDDPWTIDEGMMVVRIRLPTLQSLFLIPVFYLRHAGRLEA